MWAIVPIKSLEAAKRRLAEVLSPEERRALMLAMARDVLTALVGCRALTGVLIVSRSPEADALAQTFGTERFTESPDADLSAALTQAAEHAALHLNAHGILVVPADVPLISPGEIAAVLEGHTGVTVVPDDERLGTNALACSPPGLIRLRFDGRSFRPHVDAAFAAGVQPRVVPSARLSLDVDTPDDLLALLARGPDTQTAVFLQRTGIARRLGFEAPAGRGEAASTPGEARARPLDGRGRDAHND